MDVAQGGLGNEATADPRLVGHDHGQETHPEDGPHRAEAEAVEMDLPEIARIAHVPVQGPVPVEEDRPVLHLRKARAASKTSSGSMAVMQRWSNGHFR